MTIEQAVSPARPACEHCGTVSRRVALGAGLAAGAAVLAACTSSPETPVGSTTAAATSNSSSAVTSSSTASSSATSAASSSSVLSSADTSSAEASSAEPETSAEVTSAAPETSAVPIPTTTNYGALDAIPEGSALIAGPEASPVALARTGANVVAFSAVCTHQGCTVNARGAELVCPCHASKFDPLSGAVLGGPAPSPLPSVAVQVVEGVVYGA